MGFDRTQGVDPYATSNDDRVLRGRLDDATGQYDLIMFHHSLEHVDEPTASLAAASKMLFATTG